MGSWRVWCESIKAIKHLRGPPIFPQTTPPPGQGPNNAGASIPAIGRRWGKQNTGVGQRASRQQMAAQSFASIESSGRRRTGRGRGAISGVLVEKGGRREEAGVWRFSEQVEMDAQGDIGVFNYPQIQCNFLLFWTTPPAVRLMGVPNKEAWRSRLFDCGLVGRGRGRSVFIHLPHSTFLCHLAALNGALRNQVQNFKVHFN